MRYLRAVRRLRTLLMAGFRRFPQPESETPHVCSRRCSRLAARDERLARLLRGADGGAATAAASRTSMPSPGSTPTWPASCANCGRWSSSRRSSRDRTRTVRSVLPPHRLPTCPGPSATMSCWAELGPRRHGAGLQGGAAQPRAHRRPQDDPSRQTWRRRTTWPRFSAPRRRPPAPPGPPETSYPCTRWVKAAVRPTSA